jgi:hypothetical protein
MEDVAQVKGALCVLYTDPDGCKKGEADQWLRSFQRTTRAWMVADALLRDDGLFQLFKLKFCFVLSTKEYNMCYQI